MRGGCQRPRWGLGTVSVCVGFCAPCPEPHGGQEGAEKRAIGLSSAGAGWGPLGGPPAWCPADGDVSGISWSSMMLLSVASPNQARTSCPDNRPAELGSLMDSPRQPPTAQAPSRPAVDITGRSLRPRGDWLPLLFPPCSAFRQVTAQEGDRKRRNHLTFRKQISGQGHARPQAAGALPKLVTRLTSEPMSFMW